MFRDNYMTERPIGAIGSTRFHFREDSARIPTYTGEAAKRDVFKLPDALLPIFEEILGDLAKGLVSEVEIVLAEAYMACATYKNHLAGSNNASAVTHTKMKVVKALTDIHLNAGKVFDTLKSSLRSLPCGVKPLDSSDSLRIDPLTKTALNEAKVLLHRCISPANSPSVYQSAPLNQGVAISNRNYDQKSGKVYMEDQKATTCQYRRPQNQPVDHQNYHRESSLASSRSSWDSAEIHQSGTMNMRRNGDISLELQRNPEKLEKQCLKFELSDDPFEAKPLQNPTLLAQNDQLLSTKQNQEVPKRKLVFKEEFNLNCAKPALNAKVELFKPTLSSPVTNETPSQPAPAKTKLKPSAAHYDPNRALSGPKKLMPSARQFTPQTGAALTPSHSVTQLIVPIQQPISVVGLMPVYTTQALTNNGTDSYDDGDAYSDQDFS